jgi:hypothetical protein
MNGRLYDPVLSRFIQADPIIQSPFDGQSLNRYTYVWNNPLAYTDPSGYTAQPKWLRAATTLLAIYVTVQTGINITNMLQTGSALVGGSCVPATLGHAVFTAAAGGAASGVISSGSPKGALSGAASSVAFFGTGQLAHGWGVVGKSLAHGVTGGILDELQGGSFGHGFINAGASKYLHTNLVTGQNVGVDGVISALIGGTISEATGGDFANGAVTAAMQYAMNCLQNDTVCKAGLARADEQRRAMSRDIFDAFTGPIAQVINFFTAAQEGDVVGMAMEASPAGRAKRLGTMMSVAHDAGQAGRGLRTAEQAGISPADARRIQNAANRTRQEIIVIGSRARGTSNPLSDWDYILTGPSRARGSASRSIPRGEAGGAVGPSGRETGIDVFQNYNPRAPDYLELDPSDAHVIFSPR